MEPVLDTPAPLPAAATGIAPQPIDAARIARARWSTGLMFLTLGVLSGAWGAHVPSVKATYGLGEAALSVVLLAAACGAVSALFIAGRAVGRLGARRVGLLAGLSMCTMLALVLLWPGLPLLLPAMLVFGACMSLFDVSINAEGTAIESLGRRAVMSQLHGMFSVGGMTGAGLVAAMFALGLSAAQQLVAVALVFAGVLILATRGMLDAHPHEDGGEKAHFVWPRGLLLIIGLLIFAGMTAEGVMYDWCVLYLKQDIGMPQAQAALGYAAFSAAMALARFGGDALRARYSERAILRVGATMAAVTMAVVLLAASPWVALVGFTLVGAGLAPVAPILFNAATRVPGVSRAAAIASVTSIGYSGFMIGPPLIGSIAQNSSLTMALGLVVLAAALLAIGSRSVPVAAPSAPAAH